MSDDLKISKQLPSLTHTFLARSMRSLTRNSLTKLCFSIPSQISTTISHFLFSVFPLTFFLSPFILLRTNKTTNSQPITLGFYISSPLLRTKNTHWAPSMTGEVHVTKHTSKTMPTRRMKTDESKKSETRKRNQHTITEMEKEFGKTELTVWNKKFRVEIDNR